MDNNKNPPRIKIIRKTKKRKQAGKLEDIKGKVLKQ